MGELSLRFSASLNGAEAKRELISMPDRITNAMRRGTREATDTLANNVRDYHIERAGGPYWDIYQPVIATPQGAVGRITTPPNSERTFGPKGPPDGKSILRWVDEDGTVVWAHQVDHPGSNSPDWTADLEGGRWVQELERPFEDQVARVIGGGGGSSAFPSGGVL